MSAWPFACLIVACIFAVLWYFFSLLKGKAAIFISGFNSFSKEKREKYDMDRMVKDQADSFALWTVVLFAGFILGLTVHAFCSAFLFVTWVLIFFRDVHLDADEAFEKYRREDKQ